MRKLEEDLRWAAAGKDRFARHAEQARAFETVQDSPIFNREDQSSYAFPIKRRPPDIGGAKNNSGSNIWMTILQDGNELGLVKAKKRKAPAPSGGRGSRDAGAIVA
ncbi:hypothetical protein NLM16_05515 [Bradyrhizobium brasilense]|uniref:hypothetical protein n=1 Tax=Bradyrhizobium brasilense TaxID=1419277 RepID=UPI0028772E03|nr:hypothetical protein [Bradyrhizobium brasilense]MCP3413555.1 hypothetical protein [Bradyrhizobium brasilense]